jgi:hypothetical protein
LNPSLGNTEDNTDEVEIKDFDDWTMKSLLSYIYENYVPKYDPDIDLLLAAEKYNLADLVLLCEDSVISNISDETVLDIAASSRLLASQKVFEAAKKFIDTRPIKSLKAGNDWKMFNKENPEAAKEITQKPPDKKIEKSKPKTEFRYAKMNINSCHEKAIKEAMFKRAFVFESYDSKVNDVYIICNGESFKCHKAILSARSDVFAAMFEMSKDNTDEVEIEDIDDWTMKSLLLYIYENFADDADINLLLAAEKYNLADLVLLCEDSVISNISDETVLDIAASSRLLASQNVFEATKKFINARPLKSLKAGNVWKMFKTENPTLAKEITQKPTTKKIKKIKPVKVNEPFVFESDSKILYDKKNTDVNIVCYGETFKCHKAILAARSDVFAAMFEMSGHD